MIVAQILKYSLLPQIKPRVTELVSSGFGFLASFMAQAYRTVRLLPENHPYLQSQMTGQYSVMDVLREAANNVEFKLQNIDQIIIFFALIIGVVLLGLQFILLLLTAMINPASAGPTTPENYGDFFVLDGREQDIALRILDRVFGVPEIFGTGEATETPFHTALHQLFQFYSIGLIVIAALILAYFIFAVIAETAQHGTPFGKRYNHVWAPIRLVAAIGLLVPISYGLNAGQWITLYAAKFGSGFATNGWIEFNATYNEARANEELVATVNPPDLKAWVSFMMIARACYHAYNIQEFDLAEDIQAWVIDPDSTEDPIPFNSPNLFQGWVLERPFMHVRFGAQNARYNESTSNIFPHCGEIVFSNVSFQEEGEENSGQFHSYRIPVAYISNAIAMWEGATNLDADDSTTYTEEDLEEYQNENNGEDPDWSVGDIRPGFEGAAMDQAAFQMVLSRLTHNQRNDPADLLKTTTVSSIEARIANVIRLTAEDIQGQIGVDENIEAYGWGGAAIWYNRIANANGYLTTQAMNKPNVSQYPHIMEFTCDKNQQQNDETSPTECYNPRLAKDLTTIFQTEDARAIATALSDVFNFWQDDGEKITGNAFIDTINAVLGTQGIFNMCENADIHPLGQLSSAGKGLVEAAIRNLAFGLGFGAAGILTPYFGTALQAASGFFVSVASMGLLIGFILYYIVPFMPFLYFFFAVGGWVKGIFEAMVGVPLWALAHLRIDGEGLPGDAAINGYFLIFEIFVRPILIIFGLLASILIFGAMVKVLNEIFSLVVSNLSGFSTANSEQCGAAFPAAAGAPTGSVDYLRGPVDEFFFTIVYAILVYMIGMASFKLIDMIPNQILRWMGAGVSTFNDQAGEPAEGLVTKLAVGGGIMGSQLGQAGQGASGAISNLGGAAGRFVTGGRAGP